MRKHPVEQPQQFLIVPLDQEPWVLCCFQSQCGVVPTMSYPVPMGAAGASPKPLVGPGQGLDTKGPSFCWTPCSGAVTAQHLSQHAEASLLQTLLHTLPGGSGWSSRGEEKGVAPGFHRTWERCCIGGCVSQNLLGAGGRFPKAAESLSIATLE